MVSQSVKGLYSAELIGSNGSMFSHRASAACSLARRSCSLRACSRTYLLFADSLRFALCVSLTGLTRFCFLPFRAFDIFAHVSGLLFIPLCAASMFAACSGESFFPKCALLILSRASASRLAPRCEPALGLRLYSGFKKSMYACSRETRFSL